jgi:hypothetical protein
LDFPLGFWDATFQAFIFIFLQLLHELALSITAAFGHFFFNTQHLCDIIEVDDIIHNRKDGADERSQEQDQ